MNKITDVNVYDFLNTDVKDYALYVLRTRALPSLMDGMRIGARKILWAAIKGELIKGKKMKFTTFMGAAMGIHYLHGDSSIKKTIEQLSSKHTIKYPPLNVLGQMPSLRDTKTSTASRYLDIKIGDYIDIFTKDINLLTILVDEGEKIEPLHLLPIIPVQLLYRTNSPGFGFSYRAMSYSLDNIIDNCIYHLLHGNCNDANNPYILKPDIIDIKPDNIIFNASKNSWYNIGEYQLNFEKDVLLVNDLPYNIQFTQFEEHLDYLKENGIIIGWVNYSVDNNISYGIKFGFGELRKQYYNNKFKFYNQFKLISKLPADELNCIDVNGSIMFFDNPYHLIDVFVERRLTYYEKRRTSEIESLKDDMQTLLEVIKFITLINNGELIISNRPIEDIRADLDKYQLPHTLLKLSISRLSKTDINEYQDEYASLQKQLVYYENVTPTELYIDDLIELKIKTSTINQAL
jgi:DNA gyrase/topoisomerase IV subunit A